MEQLFMLAEWPDALLVWMAAVALILAAIASNRARMGMAVKGFIVSAFVLQATIVCCAQLEVAWLLRSEVLFVLISLIPAALLGFALITNAWAEKGGLSIKTKVGLWLAVFFFTSVIATLAKEVETTPTPSRELVAVVLWALSACLFLTWIFMRSSKTRNRAVS